MTLMLELRNIFEAIYISGNKETIKRCIKFYEDAINKAKTNPNTSSDELAEAYTWIVSASFQLGDLEKAIQATKIGIDLTPSPAFQGVLYNNQAAAYALNGDKNSAKKSLEKALEYATIAQNPILFDSCRKNLLILESEEKITQVNDVCLNNQDKINFG